MITLTLLHPMQSIPVQSWTFEHESVIRIGRSTDNHVILYSAVVSRHHVEVRKLDSGWEIVNLGANGTYLEGRRINQVVVEDGVIIRLARSGPNVQIHLGAKNSESVRPLASEKFLGQRTGTVTGSTSGIQTRAPDLDDLDLEGPVSDPAITDPLRTDIDHRPPASAHLPSAAGQNISGLDLPAPHLQTSGEFDSPPLPLSIPSISPALSPCCDRHLNSERLFCLDCGKPLRVMGAIANYQILRTLEQDAFGSTELAWRDGKTLVLRTLHPDLAQQPEAVELFAQEAQQFLALEHAALPHFLEFFVEQGKPHLVMEPTYGLSLQAVVEQEGTLAPAIAIDWVTKACHALEYLHQQTPPILHQDLNPLHLIRRPTHPPSIALVGFSPGRLIKTVIQPSAPGYTAPEQYQGIASPASDLYALAPILVFLLTGKPPDAFYTQREQGIRFYPEYVPGLPPDLIAILRKLTHPVPSDRYPSATALIADLDSVTVEEKLGVGG